MLDNSNYLDNSKTVPDNNLNKLSTLRRRRKSIKVKNYTEVVKRSLFKCRACGSTYKSKQLLFKHVGTHIGTPISCLTCKKGFNSRLAYTCHNKLRMCIVKPRNIQFPCDQCPKVIYLF